MFGEHLGDGIDTKLNWYYIWYYQLDVYQKYMAGTVEWSVLHYVAGKKCSQT